MPRGNPVSSGDALIHGCSIRNSTGMSNIRRMIGVCPQFDVLWDGLSGKEHLHLFANIKGLAPASIQPSYVKCVPVRVSRSFSFGVFSDSVSNQKSLSAQLPPNVTADEVLNRIVAAMDDSVSQGEISIRYTKELCASGSVHVAVRVLHALRDKHIFSFHAYNCVLEAAAAANDIDLVTAIFKDLLSCRSIQVTSYLCLARAFLNHKDISILLTFITEVSEMILPIRDIVLNRFIFALGKSGQIDKALFVFQNMKHLKCKPDLVTFNTMFAFLGRLGRVDEMLLEFEFMKTVDIIPDIFTYNTVLNSLRKIGRLDLCLVYFKEMCDRGIQPDILTFKDLIESLGRSGNIEGALKVFNEMKCMGIRPSVQIYIAIIFSLKRMGKMESALKFSNEMNKCLSNVVPRDFQYEKR